jgi:hypothetical protein
VNYGGSDLLYCFSTAAPPFAPETAYTKFAIYVLLGHGADFAAAAKALSQLGYGDQRPVATRPDGIRAKRVLRRIVEVTVFAPDGSLQTAPGYHAGSRTYYAPHHGFTLSLVPERPTAQDIHLTCNLILKEVLADFPFTADAECTHAVSLFLLPFCRDLIDGPTPLHLIEAPCEESGKGLPADVCLQPAIGRRFGALAPGRDRAVMKKSGGNQSPPRCERGTRLCGSITSCGPSSRGHSRLH